MNQANRPDLLTLDDAALTALANPGFVKRALRDLAEGLLPQVQVDGDGSLHAIFSDGIETRLAAGQGMREARCSCTATGLCRHRVSLVVAYRAQHASQPEAAITDDHLAESWSPAALDAADIATWPRSVRDAARKLMTSAPVVELQAWRKDAQVPTAKLPMCTVRFLSRHSLTHAHCDCKLGQKCEHVIVAHAAFVQADPDAGATCRHAVLTEGGSAATHASVAISSTIGEELQSLILQLWQDGMAQPRAHWEPAFNRLLQQVRDVRYRWLEEDLLALHHQITAWHERSTDYSDDTMLELCARLPARHAAARHATAPLPPSAVLGIGVPGEVALAHLRLIGLGTDVWSSQSDHGVRLLFVDPDTQTILALERRWPHVESDALATPLISRRVAGQSVTALANSQVVTRGARRRANGTLELGGRARDNALMPLSPTAWDDLAAPVRFPDATTLRRHLRDALPEFVQPSHVAARVHVLPVHAVHSWGWDAATQILSAVLQCGPDPDTDAVLLQLSHNAHAKHAVDGLARALQGEHGAVLAVSGHVSLKNGYLQMRPLALACGERMLVLNACDTDDATLPVLATPQPPAGLLDDVRALVLRSWQRGLRHVSGNAITQARELADTLRGQQLPETARALRGLFTPADTTDATTLPLQASRLILLLAALRDDPQLETS